MERRLWAELYVLLVALGKAHDYRRKRYSDACVALVFLWSVVHDRPRAWACDPDNWVGRPCPWDALPSPSRLSRRLRTVPVLGLVARAEAWLRDRFPDRAVKWFDAKPLPVGGASKDRDARPGRAARGTARGYKLHAVVDAGGPADGWRVAGMDANEQPVARAVFAAGLRPGALYVVADNQYDGNGTADACAAAGAQLVAAPRRAKPAGVGHRRQSPHRLRSKALGENPLAACGQATSFGQDLLHGRGGVERRFGQHGNVGGGLGPLPNWVRRPRRVALWVAGKLLLDMLRALFKRGVKTLDLTR